MIALLESPALLAVWILVLIGSGLIVMTWGRLIARYSSLLIGSALALLLVIMGIAWAGFIERDHQAVRWLTGWILPREESGAITVGILGDGLAFTVSSLVCLLSLGLLLNRQRFASEQRPERLEAAIALSAAGVTLAWLALTPWLVFVGIGIVVFAGFVGLGSRWSEQDGAVNAIRFAWERSWGLLMAVMGAAVLASERMPLGWNSSEPWSAAISGTADWIGAALLLGGLFAQLQSFPFLGWVLLPSEVPAVFRVVVNQVLPAWAAFAILVRWEEPLRAIGILPVAGWFALFSAVLSVCSGLFQRQWRQMLGTWVSAAFAISASVFCFAGARAGFSVLIATGLGAAAISAAVSATRANSEQGRGWFMTAVFTGVASAVGILGFASSGGFGAWLALVWEQSSFVVLISLGLFLLSLAGWRLAWSASRIKAGMESSWYSILSPLFFVLLALGWVWTGTATGGALAGNPDRLSASLLDIFFTAGDESAVSANLGSAIWVVMGVNVAAFMAAYWTAGRKVDLWARAAQGMPRTAVFLAGGYGIDFAGQKILGGLKSAARTLDWLIGEKLTDGWVAKYIDAGLNRLSSAVTATDEKLTAWLNRTLERSTDLPAKALQLVQNGDVQWYLVFALGAGIAMMLHFLRT